MAQSVRMKILGLVLVGVVVIQFTVVPSNDMALEAAPNDAHSVYLPLIRAGVAPVIPDTTVVLDDATLADLTSLLPNGTLVFAHAHPSLTTLQPNDVLVGSVTAAAPSGFLRMVDSVTEANGQILVQTHQATLEDAIQDGAMFIHQGLSPTAVTAVAMMDGVRSVNQSARPASSEFALQLNDVVLYDHDNNPATENDRILANGSVRLNLSYEFDMVVNSGQLERLMIKSISTETAELEISSSVTIAEVDVKKELARYTFTPIVTYVGVLPVVFVPVLTINVGINGTLQATVSASVTQQATSTSGLQYANGTWQPIQSFVNSFTYNPPTLSTSLDAKAFIGTDLSLLLYGVTGPFIKGEVFLELEADPAVTPWWMLYGGLKVDAGVEIEVISHVIASYHQTILDWRKLLLSAPTAATPTAIVPTAPTPTATVPFVTPTPSTATPTITPAPNNGTTTRVSVASDGTQGNDPSGYFSNWTSRTISADGRYVVFNAAASNLVPSDTNNRDDVFVKDLLTGQTTRVSVDSNGTEANGSSGDHTISANGRYVSFGSFASNLVPNDNNAAGDVFVHDMVTGQTVRASLLSNGGEGLTSASNPSLSADGRYVAFESNGIFVPGNPAQGSVYVHDMITGQTSLASVSTDGIAGAHSGQSSLSGDGRFVAFSSDTSNLVPNDTNNTPDVFVHDMQTGQTTRMSITSEGGEGNKASAAPSISNDGRFVSFTSLASNLVTNDTNNVFDIFVHDRQTGQTTRVSVASDGSQLSAGGVTHAISADGQYIAFDTAGGLFIHDMQNGQTMLVSIASDGTQGNNSSDKPSLSAEGRFVVFASTANNLVPEDTNGTWDIFVRDRGVPTR